MSTLHHEIVAAFRVVWVLSAHNCGTAVPGSPLMAGIKLSNGAHFCIAADHHGAKPLRVSNRSLPEQSGLGRMFGYQQRAYWIMEPLDDVP